MSPSAWTPPNRDGVGPSRVATPGVAGIAALDFLAERLPLVSRSAWQSRLQAGDVFDAHGQPVAADSTLRPHSHLWYWRQLPPEPPIPFEEAVLYQDDHLVVADKPHFLPMTPKGRYVQQTLLVRLKRRLGIDTLVPLHRLDRETAGVVMFGIRPAERHVYQVLFRDRAVQKSYEAIAPWRDDLTLPRTETSRLVERPGDAFMQMMTVPGEPNAITHIALLERRGPWARYRLRPHTGRKHQLRAQMAALHMPIAGDRLYPTLLPVQAADDHHAPLQLLARSIGFTDPVTGEVRRFESRRDLVWPAAVG